jgi:hypothetical protein
LNFSGNRTPLLPSDFPLQGLIFRGSNMEQVIACFFLPGDAVLARIRRLHHPGQWIVLRLEAPTLLSFQNRPISPGVPLSLSQF